jgi:FtsP/CotA-like multicopper oxidase with cupredoxin domain
MSQMNTKKPNSIARLLPVVMVALAMLLAATAHAAAPGITGTSFSLSAEANYLNQPDGAMVYSWGYGCLAAPSGFLPAAIPAGAGDAQAKCPTMQVPGPTMIVNEGATITITLTNNLPAAAGNTSILFPGFQVCTGTITAGVCAPNASDGVAGLLTREAVHGGTVTYTFVASHAGTHSYYSGTQGDLQIEMGLYGAIIVIPTAVPSNIAGLTNCHALAATLPDGQNDFRLAASAYDIPQSCYDREYLFQWAEMDPKIHQQAEAIAKCVPATGVTCPTNMNTVATENYHPAYFLINGRSMPDDMDPNYASIYPHQPYNGNPHMHPGEMVLVRAIGQGRWQHPFHEHGNHVRMLGRDGNLLLSNTNPTALAGPLLFNTDTTPGIAFEGIFYWSGRGLNWDVYGHGYPGDTSVCVPDANGYYTVNSNPPAAPNAPNYYEWCQDHNHALEVAPFGLVAGGGPVTLPNPNILTNGPWYAGSPYLGPDANLRATAPTSNLQPSRLNVNSPQNEAGFAYMWHSHNEREITTNNVFPGGMLMMMLVDPPVFVIDETL